MKKYFLALMFLCLSIVLKSENYHPFPTEHAIWHSLAFQFIETDELYHEMFSHQYFINGDTIIESETWQKIYFTNNYLGDVDFKGEMNYVAAIRENEQNQILAKFPENPKIVLYDFSLEVGDTIWYDYAAYTFVDGNNSLNIHFGHPHYKVVIEKDLVQLETGEYRNRLTLDSYDDNYGNIFTTNVWIEGIGCTRWAGLFNPLVIFFTDNGDEIIFACFMQDEEVIYLDNPYCDDCLCETYTSIDYIDNTDKLLTVYPNPSKGDLTLIISESYANNLALRISDISGKKIFDQHLLNQQEINLNLVDYRSGIYIIQLWDVDRNKLIATEKIIIE